MSHFSVIVIGDNVERLLQPYHEFECTGDNDEFVQDVDMTDEVLEHMVGEDADALDKSLCWYGLEDKIVDDESKVQKVGDDCPHKHGFAIVKEGKLVKAVKRTNPNKKWDWWVVGGRWNGFLKLKPEFGGGGSNERRRSEVDFDGMRDESGAGAAARWDKAHAAKVAAGFDVNSAWASWEHVRDVLHAGDINAARDAYNAQPIILAIRAAMGHPFRGVDEYLTPRDEYIQQARDSACAPYAVVNGGEWIAKGTMGWFGMSDDTATQGEWNRRINELLDSLPGGTKLTVVDCHI